jgi:RNA polymerase sigma-70 factor (ECF subfamily)
MSDSVHDLHHAGELYALSRGRLFGIAYRMLGTVADAEDLLQEVWIRWQMTDRSTVREPAAFLATITTRMAINALQTARVRRETYIGPWLPEPVSTEDDPTLGAERAEALNFAVLLLLEKLTPTERAAYILREALDYPYERIADVIRCTPVSARQLVSRARRHLSSDRRNRVAASDHRRLLELFLKAAQDGDTAGLERLFASDIVSYTDGNGAKLAARIPVAGVRRVATFVAAFSGHFWRGKSIRWVEINGQAGVALLEGGRVTTILTVVVSGEHIQRLLWVMSPEKLRYIAIGNK